MNNNSIICEKLNYIIDAYLKLRKASNLRDNLENQRLGHKPQKPTRRIAKQFEVYPESTLVKDKKITWGAYLLAVPAFIIAMIGAQLSDTVFLWVGVLAGIYVGLAVPFGWVWALIYSVYIFPKKQDEDKERIRNTPEFIKKVEDARKADEARQYEYDKEYERAYKIYEAELKQWNIENDKFEAQRRKNLEECESSIRSLRNFIDKQFESLYEYGGIPEKYRQLDIVKYVYNILSTTPYTLKDALEMYDREQLIELQNRRLEEQQRYNDLQEEANDRAAYMNELQERANEVAEKTRRDQNIANAALLYQSKKRTQMMKDHYKQTYR